MAKDRPLGTARRTGVQDFDGRRRDLITAALPENNGSLAKNGARASIARGSAAIHSGAGARTEGLCV